MKTYVFLPDMPLWVLGLMAASVWAALWAWYKASSFSYIFWVIAGAWILMQGLLGINGFYQSFDTVPPRFLALIAPPLVALVWLMCSQKGQQWVARFHVSTLLWVHAVRVPVEVCLWMLHQQGYVPESMTWSGRNWDIISGLTAPLMWYWGYQNPILPRWAILLWNLMCLLLLINIVFTAVLAAPTPFQQWDVQQPNIGVFAFPFLYLPAVIVPLVLASHLIALRQLVQGPNTLANPA